MTKFSNRKGFTLVELLIVIVVIGILAAMMMLSSTEAVSSARATKLISDMTQIKKAINAWYLENYERLGSGAGGDKSEIGIMLNGTITRFSEFINSNGTKEFMRISTSSELQANQNTGTSLTIWATNPQVSRKN